MREDMISNALVRLSSRVCNFIAAHKSLKNSSEAARSRTVSLRAWQALAHEFDVWFDGLPPTFKPSARIRPSQQPYQPGPGDKARMFWEIWYAVPMCASTMQHYHMARILMMLNKPYERTVRQEADGDALRLGIYDMEDIVYHCYEIWYVGCQIPFMNVTEPFKWNRTF